MINFIGTFVIALFKYENPSFAWYLLYQTAQGLRVCKACLKVTLPRAVSHQG